MTTGEVTELKHQSKAVEITANGTTSITPDAGFAALNAVEVKVNVPQGEGGGASDEGDWEYYDVSAAQEDVSMYAAYFSGLVKLEKKGVPTAIGCVLDAYALADYDRYIAVAVNYGIPSVRKEGVTTLRDYINANPALEVSQIAAALQSFPRLTKEEFYNL